ncbi:ABC transporter ATP-binding protein [Winogradskyella sp. DF17]|jgi:peptide/nickel transport system ATP-binding protein|uniref:ABC transporter ATP-binding protein n=1 Tax=Winogradskyella pelagia TaxID=2819984 RepID=A0ABS3T082_9FLAO|nr:ABC transporter ATP-binding protein [Winogradskyella sp. DF17]MBO3115165.1 ABC transporter ATP-binding protein [Winogradskyella sp. DF17]
MTNSLLLKVESLAISFKNKDRYTEIIKSISFELPVNSITAIVGESGSGKSVTALALMGLLPPKLSKLTSGNLLFMGKQLIGLPNEQFRKIRGKDIAMIFQEPMSSLNPSMRCGNQVAEILKEHCALSELEIRQEVLNLFEQVKLPNPNRIYKAYPHEISGGQKQRVMIAMAIACKPKLLIADEPTTALDVTVQKEILDLLKDIQGKTKMSILFISHDLALVSELAHNVIVMYKGEIVEQGTKSSIFNTPEHRYTKALIGARPSTNQRLKSLPTISDFMSNSFRTQIITKKERQKKHNELYAQKPLLEINDVKKTYVSKVGWFKKDSHFNAVDGVSFNVYPGETLGLVGESGCGKSTLGNVILQLDKATAGTIVYNGKDITNLSKPEMRQLRKDIQIIFQDPFASLNPRLRVGEAILEPMKVYNIGNNSKDRKQRVLDILVSVGLTEEAFDRFPHEFSGGQRQRIGIARTIALKPKLIICDESVSALDISVQAQVLNLLNDLKVKFGFTYIFISHDLSVVKYMADQLVVMNNGEIEEIGEADSVFANPQKDYTKRLINAIPGRIEKA